MTTNTTIINIFETTEVVEVPVLYVLPVEVEVEVEVEVPVFVCGPEPVNEDKPLASDTQRGDLFAAFADAFGEVHRADRYPFTEAVLGVVKTWAPADSFTARRSGNDPLTAEDAERLAAVLAYINQR